MQVELTKVGEVYKEGKWPKMIVEYVRDGKPQKRTLVAVGDTKKVMSDLSNFKAGDQVEVKVEKDGDFWNWVGVEVPAKVSPKTSFTGRSTYETPEERARRQVYIVRQSSIANALEFLNAKGNKSSVDEVIDVAKKFVSFVFSTEGQETVNENDDGELKDDIPF